MVVTSNSLYDHVQNKLEYISLLKAQAENELQTSQDDLEMIIKEIDEAVLFHTENLQKRANWLKSHAEHVYSLTQDTFCERLNQLNETSSDLLKSLENAESKGFDEVSFGREIESCFPNFRKPSLTFHADNTSLSEAILAFGNISTRSVKGDMESNESFVFADDDRDGIEIVSKEENSNVLEWLREKPSIEQHSSLSNSDDIELKSWLCSEPLKEERASSPWILDRKSSDSDSGISVPSKPVNVDEDYASFLIQNVRIEEKSSSKDQADHSIYLLPTRRNSQQYQYPTRSFLDHMEYLENQDMHSYLVPKKEEEDLSSGKLDEETCQWLYRKDKCDKNKCSEDGCDLFDKNWLHTVSDW